MITVTNLTKTYGKHKALKGISFTIEKGQIVGFLGPNGAGKSTTMNIITGCISSTGGNVCIDGMDILKEPIACKKKIGYLPEIPPLYMNMTVGEYLKFICELNRIKKQAIEKELCRVMSLTQITSMRQRLIQNLSKGYRQRVGISQALIGDPEILILDEPTVGLDPKQIIDIRHLIETLSQTRTVILSTHILSEISAVCDRVLIINKGHLIANDTVEHLIQSMTENNKIILRLQCSSKEKNILLAALRVIENVIDVHCIGEKEIGTLDFMITGDSGSDLRSNLYDFCREQDYTLLSLQPLTLTLEDVFIRLTKKEVE